MYDSYLSIHTVCIAVSILKSRLHTNTRSRVDRVSALLARSMHSY